MPTPFVVLVCAESEWSAICSITQPVDQGILAGCAWRKVELAGHEVTFLHTGWGKIAAAAGAQAAIDRWDPRLLINIGSCGGLAGQLAVGDVVLADRVIVYDIIEQIGDPQAALDHYTTRLNNSEAPSSFLSAKRVTLVSADRDCLCSDVEILKTVFGASAVDWESGAIAFTARKNGRNAYILRAVTDVVSPDRGSVYGDENSYQLRVREIMGGLLRRVEAAVINQGFCRVVQ